MVFIKQSFSRQAALEFGKGGEKGAVTPGGDGIDDDLVLPPGLVNGEPAPADDLVAVTQRGGEITLLPLEKNRLELGRVVLEGEIEVARIGAPEVGDLSADRDKGEAAFDEALEGAGDLADGLDFGFKRAHGWSDFFLCSLRSAG